MTDLPPVSEAPQPDPRIRDQWSGIPIRERYGLILVLLLFEYVLTGFGDGRLIVAISSLTWVTILLATLWTPSVPRRLRQVGLVAIALVLVLSISLGVLATDVAAAWRLVILAVATGAAMIAILSRILRHDRVTFQTVMGALAAYALIAFVMGDVYHAGDLFSSATFLKGVIDNGDYDYFSFVTLTTVGYGDITAASDVAKRLVVVEAFVGQVFLITLVARLVALWGRPIRPS